VQGYPAVQYLLWVLLVLCGTLWYSGTLLHQAKPGGAACFIVTINTRDWSIGLFNWLVSMGFIIRFKGASSPLTACAPHACARPVLDQPPEFLLFYFIYILLLHSSTIIVSINLIRLSLILVFSFRNAGTKKIRGTASRYPALDITLNFYKRPYFCESLLSSLTKCICNFQQSSMINKKSYSV
jgi:hypothetical protein